MKQPLRKIKIIRRLIETGCLGATDSPVPANQVVSEGMLDEHSEMPDDELAGAEEVAKVTKLLEKIEPREAEVLSLRFGLSGEESLTLKEIGAKLGLTRERVRQIQRSALKKLSEFMSYD
ncbi:MAG: sigma-70 family RNA polymerase sigma factor [Planctomycetes bacterium]|nr:sigma-70 family RNA polymerase sigma factor [Planctomycetota bacterium]